MVQFGPETVPALLTDIADQFEMVQTMADGQREFLHGVIEFYQTLISTHTTLASRQPPKPESSKTTTCARSLPG